MNENNVIDIGKRMEKIVKTRNIYVVIAGVLAGTMAAATMMIIIAMLFSGCMRLGSLGTSRAYTGYATTITIREYVAQSSPSVIRTPLDNHITKIVYIDNPFDRNIHVLIDCGISTEWDIVIGAKTTQTMNIDVPRANEYIQSCVVSEDWHFTADPPTYR